MTTTADATAGAADAATAPGRRSRRGRRRSSESARREARWAWVFLAPWVIGFLVFTAGPMVWTLWLSFTEYDAIAPPQYTGFDNYAELLADPKIRAALGNTAFFTALSVPLSVVISLGLALLLARVGRRSSGFFRTVFYLPAVTPPVAVGVLFLLLLNGQTGLVNTALATIGIEGPNWTSDPAWLKPGIVIMSLWSLGTTVVIYLAALKDVPVELYEAARLDGAGAWQQLRYVTLPMISGAIFFTVVINTIASLQMFTEAYTMYFGSAAGSGSGPEAALFYVIYLFQQAFQFFEMGYASAMAWLLFLVILAITLVQLRVARRFVHYEGETR